MSTFKLWIAFLNLAIPRSTQWNAFGHNKFVPGITFQTTDQVVIDGVYSLSEQLDTKLITYTEVAHSINETIIFYVFNKSKDLAISCTISSHEGEAIYNIVITSQNVGFVIDYKNKDVTTASEIINSYW
jgi:hypothetical protein